MAERQPCPLARGRLREAHLITIVDSGVGNIGSIKKMLARAGVDAAVSAERDVVENAQKLILPGIGAFDAGMQRLRDRGLIDVIVKRARDDKVPLLGICLGAQMLFEKSEEGALPGLGLFAGDVVKFKRERMSVDLKIPHMGWSDVVVKKPSALFEGMPTPPRFYFVHSFHMAERDAGDVLCSCTHGYEFTAAVERGNLFAVQFHPEKSHKFGLRLLENFAHL